MIDTKKLITRLKNPGTIVALASTIVLILTTNGVQVDNERIMTTVKAVCSILVILGVMNNPETPGMYVPGVTDTKDKKKQE